MNPQIQLPLRYWPQLGTVKGAEWDVLEPYAPGDRIRQIERASIRTFMENHRELLRGRVLDYGCGLQPYRALVEGEYVPYEFGGALEGTFDAAMCNQVIEYVPKPMEAIRSIWTCLRPGGILLLTYPTNWEEAESNDLWRFTKAGMGWLLARAGFCVATHERRAEIVFGQYRFALGYGAVCTRS